MFAVIYRGFVKLDSEAQYQHYWKRIATYFVNERGALGSTLHKTNEGMWVAYSKWPNKAARDSSWPQNQEIMCSEFPPDIREAIDGLKNCLETERQFHEICMEIIEDIPFTQDV